MSNQVTYVCVQLDAGQCTAWVQQAPNFIQSLAITHDHAVTLSAQILSIQVIVLVVVVISRLFKSN